MDKKVIQKRIECYLESQKTLPKWIRGYKPEIIELMTVAYQMAITDTQNQDLEEDIKI